jgi:hypothetical protein
MRVSFFMRNVGHFRNFEWVITRMAERGHSVRLYFDRVKRDESGLHQAADKAAQDQLELLAGRYVKRIKFHTFDRTHLKLRTVWSIAARRTQMLVDYLRYLDPAFASARKPRERAGSYLKPWKRRIINALNLVPFGRPVLMRFLSAANRLIPPRRDVKAFIAREKADIVMVTPLLGFGEGQVEYFKAASALGVRSCLPVASWDNLTSKGSAHCVPNAVLVWNNAQKREAVELLHIPEAKVSVVGAYCYEHWFKSQPSSDKQTFLRKVGLDPNRDYVVFLCSSFFIAADEIAVVMQWAQALRRSGGELAEIGILIRPHPYNPQSWPAAELEAIGNVAIFPQDAENPIGDSARTDFFDTLYHCRAVVGVNTSAMIEASILGKPVHTILFDETADTQGGTLHFSHLAEGHEPLVHVARSLEEHVALLSRSLTDPTEDQRRARAFVERFVWPKEIEADSLVEGFVDALEAMAKAPAPRRGRIWLPAIWAARIVLSPLLVIYLPEYFVLASQRRQLERHREQRRAEKAKARA